MNLPSALGVPKISPVLDATVESFVPIGRLPSTTLNDGSFCELEHHVTEMNQVPSVPTFPSESVSGTISHVCALRGRRTEQDERKSKEQNENVPHGASPTMARCTPRHPPERWNRAEVPSGGRSCQSKHDP